MNKKKNGVPETYSADLKIAIAREYLSSELGFGALGKKIGYSADTIRHFVRWYRAHYPDGILVNESPVSAVEDKAVSKQLAAANLKIAALEMLIQNASKELGVDLVKKHGTKQSAK